MNGRRTVLQRDDEIEGGVSMRAGNDFEHETRLLPVRAFLDTDHASDLGIEMRLYLLQVSEASPVALTDVFLDEAPEANEQGHDLFLADLAGAADPVLGQAAEIQAGKQGRRRAPLLEEEILVEVLEQGRSDEIAPPAQDAAPLRPEDRLATADRDEIGALLEEAAEVASGRSWDAASTSTGTPFACATSVTAAREGRELD